LIGSIDLLAALHIEMLARMYNGTFTNVLPISIALMQSQPSSEMVFTFICHYISNHT